MPRLESIMLSAFTIFVRWGCDDSKDCTEDRSASRTSSRLRSFRSVRVASCAETDIRPETLSACSWCDSARMAISDFSSDRSVSISDFRSGEMLLSDLIRFSMVLSFSGSISDLSFHALFDCRLRDIRPAVLSKLGVYRTRYQATIASVPWGGL